MSINEIAVAMFVAGFVWGLVVVAVIAPFLWQAGRDAGFKRCRELWSTTPMIEWGGKTAVMLGSLHQYKDDRWTHRELTEE